MSLRQISIFLQNKPGMLARILTTLGDVGVNIRAMSLADTSDFGILRLVVSDFDRGLQVLQENRFTLRVSEVLAVEVADRPGELARILRIIEAAGINVEYMYSFVQKNQVSAVLIFRFDRQEEAARVLGENGISFIDERAIW